MKIRAWWYLTFAPNVELNGGTGKTMPQDVREYVVRRSISQALKRGPNDRYAGDMIRIFWAQAMSGAFSDQLSDELIAAAFALAPDSSFEIKEPPH